MSAYGHWTEPMTLDEQRAAARLYVKGWSVKEIAWKLGFATNVVRDCLAAGGFEV